MKIEETKIKVGELKGKAIYNIYKRYIHSEDYYTEDIYPSEIEYNSKRYKSEYELRKALEE